MKQILENCDEKRRENIFNVDDRFLKCLSNKTFAFQLDPCIVHKRERIAILVDANASITEKFPFFVIGKANKLTRFEGVKSLEATYKNNRKLTLDNK